MLENGCAVEDVVDEDVDDEDEEDDEDECVDERGRPDVDDVDQRVK